MQVFQQHSTGSSEAISLFMGGPVEASMQSSMGLIKCAWVQKLLEASMVTGSTRMQSMACNIANARHCLFVWLHIALVCLPDQVLPDLDSAHHCCRCLAGLGWVAHVAHDH